MISTSLNWEHTLLDWARQGLERDGGLPTVQLPTEGRELRRAYESCAAITAAHSRTFYTAAALLPVAKRRAVQALYAFCRRSDDLVDLGGPGARARLFSWRAQVLAPHPSGDDPVVLAWADTRARFGIPLRYAEQLLDGVARDLEQARYATFAELAQYAYGVASTVGLMSAHIVGFAGAQAIPYAVKLGVALQLTNILRDVGEDWRAGRLYLPLDELAAFGLDESDIAVGRRDERWRAFMSFQIARNRELYRESWPGIALLNPDGQFAIAAAASLYESILDDIAAHEGDVFNRRAHVSGWGKLRRLPGIWWRARQMHARRWGGPAGHLDPDVSQR